MAWFKNTIEENKADTSQRRAREAAADFQAIVKDQTYREDRLLRNLRLYTNLKVLGLDAYNYEAQRLPANRLRLNLVAAVVNTACSMLAANQTRAKWMCEGGRRADLRKAELLTKFGAGLVYKYGLHKTDAHLRKMAAVFGSNSYLIDDSADDIEVIRTGPDELWCDDVDGALQHPRTLYRYVEMDSEEAEIRFGKERGSLAQDGKIAASSSLRVQVDHSIGILQAWHLPSNPKAKDGRVLICTAKQALLDEEWTDTKFPIAKFDYESRVLGWDGQGLPEMVEDIQIEMNWILRKIQTSLNLAASHVLVEENANVNLSSINNNELGVVKFKGPIAPQWVTVQAISPEYYSQLDRLWSRGFQVTGISEMTASARKQPGIDSGRAIREMGDIQSGRFLATSQGWEQFCVDRGDALTRSANRVAKRNKEFRVLVEDRANVRGMKWSELNFDPDRDAWMVKVWPANLLPETPAGKIQALTELASVGLVDQSLAMMMLDNPDVEAAKRRSTAPRAVIEKIIDAALVDGKYIAPQPFFPLDLGISLCIQAYEEAVVDDVPEAKRDILARWVKAAAALKAQAQPPAPQMPMGLQPGQTPGPGVPIPGPAGAGGPPGMPPMPPLQMQPPASGLPQ